MSDWTNYLARENKPAVFQQEPPHRFCEYCGRIRHDGPCLETTNKKGWTTFQKASVAIASCFVLLGLISAASHDTTPTNTPTLAAQAPEVAAVPVKPAMSPEVAAMDQRVRSILSEAAVTEAKMDAGVTKATRIFDQTPCVTGDTSTDVDALIAKLPNMNPLNARLSVLRQQLDVITNDPAQMARLELAKQADPQLEPLIDQVLTTGMALSQRGHALMDRVNDCGREALSRALAQ